MGLIGLIGLMGPIGLMGLMGPMGLIGLICPIGPMGLIGLMGPIGRSYGCFLFLSPGGGPGEGKREREGLLSGVLRQVSLYVLNLPVANLSLNLN